MISSEEEERLRGAFEMALAMVKGAMGLLVNNGIEPLSEHQPIALQWGAGEIGNEEFISRARVISEGR